MACLQAAETRIASIGVVCCPDPGRSEERCTTLMPAAERLSAVAPPSADTTHSSVIRHQPYFSSICACLQLIIRLFFPPGRSALSHAVPAQTASIEPKSPKFYIKRQGAQQSDISYRTDQRKLSQDGTRMAGLAGKARAWQATTRKSSMLDSTCMKLSWMNQDVTKRQGCRRMSGPHFAPHAIRKSPLSIQGVLPKHQTVLCEH